MREANAYAVDFMGCPEPPPMLKSTVGKMGLKGVPGLNVVSQLPGSDAGPLGRRGGGGGPGGGEREREEVSTAGDLRRGEAAVAEGVGARAAAAQGRSRHH